MEVLRRLAKEPDDPDCVILAEQAINDYLKDEIDALKAALTRVARPSTRRLESVKTKIGA
jgi:hypothetical protein